MRTALGGGAAAAGKAINKENLTAGKNRDAKVEPTPASTTNVKPSGIAANNVNVKNDVAATTLPAKVGMESAVGAAKAANVKPSSTAPTTEAKPASRKDSATDKVGLRTDSATDKVGLRTDSATDKVGLRKESATDKIGLRKDSGAAAMAAVVGASATAVKAVGEKLGLGMWGRGTDEVEEGLSLSGGVSRTPPTAAEMDKSTTRPSTQPTTDTTSDPSSFSKSDSGVSLSTSATGISHLSNDVNGNGNNDQSSNGGADNTTPAETAKSAVPATTENPTTNPTEVSNTAAANLQPTFVTTNTADVANKAHDKFYLPESQWLRGHPATYGATLLDKARGICSFRVFGPHIEKCWVEVSDAAVEPVNTVSQGADTVSQVRMEMVADSEMENSFVCQLQNVAAGLAYHFVFTSKWNDCFDTEGAVLHRRDPYARQVADDLTTCHVVDASTFKWLPFEAPKHNKLVIYELHVGTFARDEGSSCFASVVSHLQHIKNMGFNAVELMPVIDFGGMWGYSPRVMMAPHAKYGTPHELRMLVNEAHQNGLAVIFDVVLGHGSVQLNSLWKYDGYGPGKQGGIYFEGDTHWGSKLALHKREIQQMIQQALMTYAIEYNVDGIRVDAAHQMPHKLLKEMTTVLHARAPKCFVVAELTPEDPKVVRETGFHSCWLHSSYYDALKIMRNIDTEHHANMLKAMINSHVGFQNAYSGINSILGSHDQCGNHEDTGKAVDPRVGKYFIEQLGGRLNWHARTQCRLWYALQAFSKPIPLVFMGTETHAPRWWHANSPMDWNAIKDDEYAKQMMQMVRDANSLRLENECLTDDADAVFCHQDMSHRVIGFIRQNKVLVIANFSENQWDNQTYRVRTSWAKGVSVHQVFNSQAEEYGGWDGSWSAPKTDGSSERGMLEVDETSKLCITLPKWSVVAFRVV